MKLRVRLAKTGLARFFSHLDLQRALERILRRAGLPIAYTQGFSPHPKISFASALATGASSEGEFIDIDLSGPMEPAEFVARATASCPAGLAFLEARPIAPKGESLTALIDAAEYRLTLAGGDLGRLPDAVAAFLAAPAVQVMKEGKSGPRLVDIRPQVYALAVTGPGELRAVTQTGSGGNLKPDDLVAGLKGLDSGLADTALALTHRLMLYRRDPATLALATPWEL